ncbi:hypothetical protein DPMN_097457 [Dreissena polymorpha]|uniref:Uncharacterized protein n=1 Tax=Dreissena polymorpha TaxID=45954 RepID=A0A9D4LBT8_DREPO|nr:hypothetical protein DPMN_097457 [Dreissena polymorpha]
MLECLQTKCGRTDSGQTPILKPHLSNQCSITSKTAPHPPGGHFHDDWAKNVTSRETNVLTKFHENWAENVTSRLFTCFHFIHIEKNAPPTFSEIFELNRDFIGTKLLTKFHEDRQ